jgi:hypothetical protein
MLNPDAREELYHAYIAEHADFFFPGMYVGKQLVLSKINLGGDHEVDLVTCFDDGSYGLRYTLIELETPHSLVYTKAGDPSARLSHAVQQVDDWRQWIAAHREEAKRLFPSKLFTVLDRPNFMFTIVIGRRNEEDQWVHKRNAYAEQHQVQIRSFDWLSESLAKIIVFPTAIGDLKYMGWDPLDIVLRHELANPFWSAFTDSDWKSIRRHPAFRGKYHMLASNAQLLASRRRVSSLHARFLDLWSKLPKAEAELLFEKHARFM